MWRDFDDRLDRRLFGSAGGGVSSWNDLTDKPFGDNEDGTVKTIDPKYLPEGSDGGVSSWNDLTDKPFGEEVAEMLILAEKTVSLQNLGGMYSGVVATGGFDSVTVGKTLKVIFDGVGYDCIANYYEATPPGTSVTLTGVSLGNMSFSGSGEDTGEPFALLVINGSCSMTAEEGAEHTVAIYEISETIKTIDPKYLPEGSGGGGAFTVTFTKNDVDAPYTADKTFAELEAAVASGAVVRGLAVTSIGSTVMHTYVYLNYYISGMQAMFSATYATNDTTAHVSSLAFKADNSVSETTIALQET